MKYVKTVIAHLYRVFRCFSVLSFISRKFDQFGVYFSLTKMSIRFIYIFSHRVIISKMVEHREGCFLRDGSREAERNSVRMFLGWDHHVLRLHVTFDDGNFRARYATLGNTDFPVIYLLFTWKRGPFQYAVRASSISIPEPSFSADLAKCVHVRRM